ncbi:seven-hairpin glycosidase [Ascobolus immersus RN42]|uniref:alpha-1,2-Mannosidase n=1 Tax=Ascobolus immersus RN42 TaxID=1160509 RepID=A0A3N4I5W1_ASCIM|nr:seven-hairpin glycosidase [Ascobolus immersus RN42]
MFRLGRHRPLVMVGLMLLIGFFHYMFFSTPENHLYERPAVEQVQPGAITNGEDTKPLLRPDPPAHSPLEPIHVTSTLPVVPSKPDATSTTSSLLVPPPSSSISAPVPVSPLIPGHDQKEPEAETEPAKPRWKPSKEHYPIPPESIIPLPTGTPKTLPRVQAAFATNEDPEARRIRMERKGNVKRELIHAWNGYKEWAWFHDEVRPVVGAPHDPFGGWAATLVDALDTLWIMGLKEEFEEAVTAVEKLDFKTYSGGAIRVFETNIRYLGGLLGAYDISDGKHPSLLKKAQELAEILYGVFDTPNRMPILSYGWEPDQVAIPQRAPSGAGAAELGSLSMEFIRLAQITKENRYYDAVQRIADALDEYQNRTLIPGLFPHEIDTSGCGKRRKTQPPQQSSVNKRQFPPSAAGEECVPQKLGRPELFFQEVYDQGAMIDSLYEYLIKNYILLGGLNDQYARMYKWSVQEAKKYIYFRPKVHGDKDILLPGQVYMKQEGQTGDHRAVPSFEAHSSHLACFVGGMVGLGAQTLRLDGDLSVAKRLTDGCVWAYNVTTTGLQPEEYNVMKCPSEGGCKFSEEEWLREAYPYVFQRERNKNHLPPVASAPDSPPEEDNPLFIANANKKFNEDIIENADKTSRSTSAVSNDNGSGNSVNSNPTGDLDSTTSANTATKVNKRDNADSDTQTPLEIARAQAKSARLPPGMLQATDSRYILRPEAIESVFYMYRITGDPSWQEKGWHMFESTIKATKVKYGHSAINNVFAEPDQIHHSDSMESFWLAETLKYYYLLFSEPDVVSLDDYVFNTEAHPFKRPKA